MRFASLPHPTRALFGGIQSLHIHIPWVVVRFLFSRSFRIDVLVFFFAIDAVHFIYRILRGLNQEDVYVVMRVTSVHSLQH
jgi:hypothetical protein